MREIKFRAWDSVNKEMFVVKDLQWEHRGEKRVFPPHEIMQLTGLHDKNGKEIFEGDIVLNDSVYQVVFEDGGFNLKKKGSFQDPAGYWHTNSFHISSFSEKVMKVIGNIHEHPHLLKAK